MPWARAMTRKRYSAEANWRKLRGFPGPANVVDCVKFVNGEEFEQPNPSPLDLRLCGRFDDRSFQVLVSAWIIDSQSL